MTPTHPDHAKAIEAAADAIEASGHLSDERGNPASEWLCESLAEAAITAYLAALGDGWQGMDEKPDRPMAVLYYYALTEWRDQDGNIVTTDPWREISERTQPGFWNGHYWCESGTGHDVFEDPGMPREYLPTHWRPLPSPPRDVRESAGVGDG